MILSAIATLAILHLTWRAFRAACLDHADNVHRDMADPVLGLQIAGLLLAAMFGLMGVWL